MEFDYYNFAQINNEVVYEYVSNDTELVLFCNNDIELINDAISRMVSVWQKNNRIRTWAGPKPNAQNHEIGFCGEHLFYKKTTIEYKPGWDRNPMHQISK